MVYKLISSKNCIRIILSIKSSAFRTWRYIGLRSLTNSLDSTARCRRAVWRLGEGLGPPTIPRSASSATFSSWRCSGSSRCSATEILHAVIWPVFLDLVPKMPSRLLVTRKSSAIITSNSFCISKPSSGKSASPDATESRLKVTSNMTTE